MGAKRGALQTTWTDCGADKGDADVYDDDRVLDGEGEPADTYKLDSGTFYS